jgi:hypothetical protein
MRWNEDYKYLCEDEPPLSCEEHLLGIGFWILSWIATFVIWLIIISPVLLVLGVIGYYIWTK